MNVCEAAKNAQEKDWRYGKADTWKPVHLNEGEKLYQLDLGPRNNPSSNFFIDENTYDQYWDPETNTFDVKSYCNDAQIAPYFDGTYKGHISEFEVGEGGLDVAYGTCENNPSFGAGGCPQIYVGDDSIGQLHKSEQQISPEISDWDRTIGKENASNMLSNSIEENLTNEGYSTLPTEENMNTQAPTDNTENVNPNEENANTQAPTDNTENVNPNEGNANTQAPADNTENVNPNEENTNTQAPADNTENVNPNEENTNMQAPADNAEDVFPAEGETKSQEPNENTEGVLPAEGETKSQEPNENTEDVLPAPDETNTKDNAEDILPASGETNAKDNSEDNSIGPEQ